MPIYRYTALEERGKETRGIIDADSLEDAKQKLLKRRVFVVKVESSKKNKNGCVLNKQEVRSFTRELAHLMKAGLPLHDSLSALEEKARSQKRHELLLDLCDKIREGVPFSRALQAHSRSFDFLYCSMITNAEQSGTFVKTLDELAYLLDRQLQMRKALLGALLYPALLGGFCLVVLSVLLFFVIPSLFDLFEGRSLHFFTQFVFSCSRFALSAKWFLLAFMAILGGGAVFLFSTLQGQKTVRGAIARMPLFRELFAKIALVRFFRAAATLIEGGMPALPALEQACSCLSHPPLEKTIEEILVRLTGGESLESAMQGHQFIPSLIPRMLGIAQKAGNLSMMMHQIAGIYEEDLEKIFARITSLAQPILLLVLGAMVGFVLLSVLLPLTDVSSFSN